MWTVKAIVILAAFAALVCWVMARAHRDDKQNANGYATRAMHRKFERDQERGWEYDPSDEEIV